MNISCCNLFSLFAQYLFYILSHKNSIILVLQPKCSGHSTQLFIINTLLFVILYLVKLLVLLILYMLIITDLSIIWQQYYRDDWYNVKQNIKWSIKMSLGSGFLENIPHFTFTPTEHQVECVKVILYSDFPIYNTC